LDLSAKGDPTSSYATGGIALRVIGVLKLPYHYKMEAPAGEEFLYQAVHYSDGLRMRPAADGTLIL